MVKAHIAIQAAKTTPGLIDDFIARHRIEPIRDDDLTMERLFQKTGWTEWRRRKAIRDDIAAGLLEKVKVLDENGHEATAYRKPVDIAPQK